MPFALGALAPKQTDKCPMDRRASKAYIFASLRYPFVLSPLCSAVDFTNRLKLEVQIASQQSWQDEMVRGKGSISAVHLIILFHKIKD